jgi:SAM-dependent methyltransferase
MTPADVSAGQPGRTSPRNSGDVNARVWGRGALLHHYTRGGLRAAESDLFERHREALSGRVLELGCGGGRLTAHLISIADTVVGIDIGPSMVEYCRKRYPQGQFLVRDIRELRDLETGSFTGVVAGFNVIDELDDRERRSLLDDMHRVLVPGGTLILSSHNLGSASLIKPPLQNLSINPIRTANRLARLPRALRNHRRLKPMEQRGADHAILNDVAHDYSLLHYYISRDGQERQLADHGFELLECVDLDGTPVGPGDPAFGSHELHYAARRGD